MNECWKVSEELVDQAINMAVILCQRFRFFLTIFGTV